MLVCMIILVLVSLWHAAQILIDYEYKDYICMGTIMGLYLLYNIYFWFKIYFGVSEYNGPLMIRITMNTD